MDFELIKSNKNRFYLNVDNFKFLIKSYHKNKRRFICKDCKLGVILSDDNVLDYKSNLVHNHPNHIKEIKKDKFINSIKEKIKLNPFSINKISYNSSLRENIQDKDDLPIFMECRSRLSKFRSKFIPRAPLNTTREELVINDDFFETPDGQQYLQIDNGSLF